ncbi:uncharacterized protein TNCV_3422281 [Trichonephila clavipes]|nr:uncharacterized protein TNCV_3422281 [Trichonephila clavipes]
MEVRKKANVDQVRKYLHRKCDEMEIRTGSSDSNSFRHKSSSYESVQRRSNESQCEKKGRTEETVMPSTRGYNLRRRKGTKVESRPTIEKQTLQIGPVRARKSREKHYNPYIKDQARSGSKNTIRRGSQQQNVPERKG